MWTLIIIFLFWVSLLKSFLLMDTRFLSHFINWLSQFVVMEIMEWVGKYGGLCSWWKSEPIPRGVTIHQTSAPPSDTLIWFSAGGEEKIQTDRWRGETVYHVIDSTCHNLCYKHKVSRLNSLLDAFLWKCSWWRWGRLFDSWHEVLSALQHF